MVAIRRFLVSTSPARRLVARLAVAFAVFAMSTIALGLSQVSSSQAATSYTVAVYMHAAPTPQAALSVTSISGTNGSPLTLVTSGGSGDGEVSYVVADGTASGCSVTTGVLTVSSAGTCVVTATKAADSTYEVISSLPTTVTMSEIPDPPLFTGSFSFTVSDSGDATVTGFGGAPCEGKHLIIPADDGAGHPVTAIGFKAFQRHNTNCQLVGVSIPSTVTSIGSEAFAWNHTMTEINIPASVTFIDLYAFTGAAKEVNTSIYFEGMRPTGDSLAFAFGANPSASIFYNSGQTGWPGVAIEDHTPVVSTRVAQSALTVTSTSGTVGTPLTLTTSGGSGWGTVSYQSLDPSAPSGCTVSGGVVSAPRAGSCILKATKSPTGRYARKSSSITNLNFSAIPTPQAALSVTSISGTNGSPLTLVTSGGSGDGEVSYVVADGTASGCSITTGVLTVSSAGTCVVTATKAADSAYEVISSSPTTVTMAFRVQAALSVTSISGTNGSPLTLVTSGGSGDGEVSYVVADGTASGCSITTGVLTVSSAGTCVVTATKAADSAYEVISSSPTTVTMAVADSSLGSPSSPSSVPDSSSSSSSTAPLTTSTSTAPAPSTALSPTTPTTSTTIPAPVESVVVGLPRAETPLVEGGSLSSGAEVSVSYGGFTPYEFVQLIVASTPQVIGSGYADARGFVTLIGRIPIDLTSGSHTLAVYAPKSGVGFNQPIKVSKTRLPATGSGHGETLYAWAMLVLFIGLSCRYLGRRRRAW
jgi:LPXTG-motif cell wall-anchored protein